MRSIDIAASTPRLDVDNRFSIRVYYRIADNILKQADIFRKEKNIVDQYIMLLRFSSLVTETIPRHREYKASNQRQKEYLKRKLLIALSESEALKPAVQQRLDEWNGKHTRQVNGWGHGDRTNSIEWPPSKNQIKTDHYVTTAVRPAAREYASQGSRTQQLSHVRPEYGKFHRMSLNFATPKVETLSKHSILGPNGLSCQWQPPKSDKGVKYPINIDFTPVEIPSLQQPVETRLTTKTYIGSAEPEKPSFELTTTPNDEVEICHAEEPSMISFETAETPASTNLIRQPSPPPVLADVQDLITEVSPAVNEMDCQLEDSLSDSFNRTEPLQLHISTTMMETFMKLAKSNTNKNLETCGVLAGSLKSRKFYVTALIIPKQESTSDSCQTTNEEEIFEVQDKQSLFPLGWIHTHPTQSCFMSSIDVHTHYSYQIMLPEAVAIVMAPRDSTRKHGIFRLTNPGGISVIRNCQQRGFHPHDPPPDGGPIYESCTDVYMNPNLKFDVIDLR